MSAAETVDHVKDAVAKQVEDLPASSRSEAGEQLPHTRHLLNRERSLHSVFGGGKAADAFLWRNKFMSVGILVGASIIYYVLEHSTLTLLSILSTILLWGFGAMFVVSNAAALLNRPPPPYPSFYLSEDKARSLALTLRVEVNKFIGVVHDLSAGKDFKLLVKVAAILWGLSVVGGWFHFLTLVYLAIVVSHTIPVVYERYEDQVDFYAKQAYEKAQDRYRDIDANLLSKLPIPGVKKAE